jgi:Cu-processing system permease protein
MTIREKGPFLLCARQELVLAARSRSTQIFAAVFGALAVAVAASGYVLSGGGGVQDFSRTSVSLVQLLLLLVPLTSLLVGVLALVPERGAAELLYAQPVARRAIWLGKLFGLFLALASAQAIGLGAAGLVIFWSAGREGLAGYAVLFGTGLLATAVSLGVAGLIAAGFGGTGRRTRAVALALIVWFAAVVLFDVAALGAASLLKSGAASRLLIVSVFVNPVDALRTASLMAIEGTSAFGSASLALLRFTRGPAGAVAALAASILLWLAVPTFFALRRVERADF